MSTLLKRTIFTFFIFVSITLGQHISLDQGNDGPIPRPYLANSCIWERKVDRARRLLLERAYIYGKSSTPEHSFGTLQYAFVMTTPALGTQRSIMGIFEGSEHILKPYGGCEIELLDAVVDGDDLLVLFNQYGKCFAYFCYRDVNKAICYVPKYDRRISEPERVGAFFGNKMKRGWIARAKGNIVAHTVDQDDKEHIYELDLVNKDPNALWKEVTQQTAK